MKRRRPTLPSAIAFTAAAVIGWSGVRALRDAASPFSTLAAAPVTIAYVSMGCSASQRLVAALERAPRDDVVVVSIDDATSRFALRSCRRALREAEHFGNRFVSVLPEAWSCRLLHEDATSYWKEHFTWVPAFSRGGVPAADTGIGVLANASQYDADASSVGP